MTKGQGVNLELDDLLHPAQAFNNPSEAVNDPDLTVNEKRAILASWASDACAIEAAPELRAGPKVPVRFEDIMEALRALDNQANGAVPSASVRPASAEPRCVEPWQRSRPTASIRAPQ